MLLVGGVGEVLVVLVGGVGEKYMRLLMVLVLEKM